MPPRRQTPPVEAPEPVAATPAPQSNVDRARQVLGTLSQGQTPVNEPADTDKVKLELPDRLKAAFIRLAGENEVGKLVIKVQDLDKEPLLEFAFDDFIDKLWGAKTRPASVEVQVRDDQGRLDSQGNFIVQTRFSINIPKPKKGETQSREELTIKEVAEKLHGAGMEEEEAEAVATRFVNTELDLTLKPTIDLDKWLRGRDEGRGTNRTWVESSPEEQDMVSRMVLILQARNPNQLREITPLTQEELKKLIEYEYRPVVRNGFLERVCGYVHSKDQLKVLLDFITPTHFFSGLEYAMNSTAQDKIERQVDVLRTVLGVLANQTE